MGNHWPCCAAAASREAALRAATRGRDFSYAGERHLAKVVDVYDGDTVRIVFWARGALVQHRARMRGYDSPEMKPPRAARHREEEKAAAVAARDALAGKVAAGELVYAECGEFDKYGRLLVTLYLRAGARNGECVNAWMLAQGHGVPYDGGRRPPWAGAA